MVSAANSPICFTRTEVRICRCMWEDFDTGNWLALTALGGIAGALLVWAAQTFELAPEPERANAFFLMCLSASIIWWRVEGQD